MKGLTDLIADIGFKGSHGKARDALGRVHEYFLGEFAAAEGKRSISMSTRTTEMCGALGGDCLRIVGRLEPNRISV